MNPSLSKERRPSWTVSLLLFAATFLSLIASSHWYGYAIDEASYLWVAREERTWFAELPTQPLHQSFSADGLARRWHFLEAPVGQETTHSNFNLPLSMHLMNVGWLLTAGQIDERLAARLASMMLFSLLVAYTHIIVGQSFGILAGWAAPLFLIASPRLWGHAHLAGTETTLSALWWFTTLAIIKPSPQNTGTSWLTVPLLLSLTMATKLSGWFLAPIVLIGILLMKPPQWRGMIVASLCLPALIIVLLTPPLWHRPIGGMIDYLRVVRENPWTIPSYFAGEVTSARLPGWTGLVIFAVTSPVTTLILGFSASLMSLGNRRILILSLSTLTLLIARIAGLLPTHDVERHFLPALYGIAILAGIAASTLIRAFTTRRALSTILLLILLAEPVFETFIYRAHGLCFYNRFIGGMAGAQTLGFETSYWWEAMTDDDWRNALKDLPTGSTVFLRPDHPGLDDLQRWGIWRSDLRSVGPEADIYLLYAKRSAYFIPVPGSDRWQPTDLGLRAEQDPANPEVRFQGVRLMGRMPRVFLTQP